MFVQNKTTQHRQSVLLVGRLFPTDGTSALRAKSLICVGVVIGMLFPSPPHDDPSLIIYS